tara:strand:+ start:386 stop:805 length:420 start_codon:yes stop_codon:yes gene_type:complete
MKKIITIKLSSILILAALLQSAPVKTTLENYAYDFPSIGYEISFPASSSYFIPMSADDYFNVESGGYTLEVRIDGLSRTARKDFVSYYNEHCEISFTDEECQLSIEGEIELTAIMSMILKAKKIDFLSSNRSNIIKSFK